MVSTASELLDTLFAHGIDFFTGVPDSVVGKLITEIEKRGLSYLPATCEDAAVGVASGAYLGGKHPAVLMQNSGLGNAGDAYMTLAKLYRLPILFIVSIPHVPEADDEVSARERANNIQHYDWERLTKPLLESVEFPYTEVGKESYEEDIAGAIETMKRNSYPHALIVRKENVL
jgi:sulfopyruvate decarboxylase TPP-binding subunit